MMVLIRDIIKDVRVFEIPNGVRENGKYTANCRMVLVKWSVKDNTDKLQQVYVNGQYAGTTIDSLQRQMIAAVPSSFKSAVRIEVFAVDAEHADVDFGGELTTQRVNNGRVKIKIVRSQQLAIGAHIQIYGDNGAGPIDYSKTLNKKPIPVWPNTADKAGFAMNRFAIGDFGYDGAGAVGFGKGAFGNGQYGLDADCIEWVSEPLPKGKYKFAIKVIDEYGNESPVVQTSTVTVIPVAKPAEELSVLSFDKQGNQLMLKIVDVI